MQYQTEWHASFQMVEILLYFLSSSCFIALIIYTFLALKGNCPLLLSTGQIDLIGWKGRLFLGLAGIGFLVCMYQGANAMLFWMPDAWGKFDEEGNFQTFRSVTAGVFAFCGGFVLMKLIIESMINKAQLNIALEQIALERKFLKAKSNNQIDIVRYQIKSKISELEKSTERSYSHKRLITIEQLELDAYRETAHITKSI